MRENPGLYGYLLAGTALAFSFFGYHIAKRGRLLTTTQVLDALAITDPLTGCTTLGTSGSGYGRSAQGASGAIRGGTPARTGGA